MADVFISYKREERDAVRIIAEKLRALRLDAARTRLKLDDASVTEVALSVGFAHLGRFSEYYRERFGELPRETRRGG